MALRIGEGYFPAQQTPIGEGQLPGSSSSFKTAEVAKANNFFSSSFAESNFRITAKGVVKVNNPYIHTYRPTSPFQVLLGYDKDYDPEREYSFDEYVNTHGNKEMRCEKIRREPNRRLITVSELQADDSDND